MSRHCVAVFTAFLFMFALVQGCLAAGDDDEPQSAYISFLITNRFLFDLAQNDIAPSETTLRGWVQKISDLLKVGIKYTERLGDVLRNRVRYLVRRMKELKGGAPRQRYFTQPWTLQVEVNELESHSTTADLQSTITSLEAQKRTLETKILSLSSQLKESDGQENRKRRKSVEDLGERQKRRLKKARESDCRASLGWLEGDGYTPVSLKVLNNSTKQIEEITLGNVEELLGASSEVHSNDFDMLDMILYVKDYYSVSDAAYHEMTQICKHLPRHYKIKDRIQELNKQWNIKPLPNEIEGVQQPLEERLKVRIEHLVKVSSPDSEFMRSRRVRIKLSGDGTCIGKRLHVVCFTFTVLEESDKTGSFEGNHVLAIFKTPENYSHLKKALEDIIKDVEKLKQIKVDDKIFEVEYFLGGDWKFLASITGIDAASKEEKLKQIKVDDKIFEVEYFLGGDWKFLASITGIDAASSTYACIWCKCSREERFDPDKEWSVTDTCKGARTVEQNIENAALPRSRQKFNVSNPPLFSSIPLSRIVIDNLHLFLRVADVLINQLITELRRQDAIDQRKRFTGHFDISKFKHLDNYEKFVTSLGIPSFQFYIGEASKQMKCRSLTGPEKLKVFENIEIQQLLPTVTETTTSRIQHLWHELIELNKLICLPASQLTTLTIQSYEQRARQWGRDFIDVYHSDKVTPYIHAMMNHVGEFMRIHGSIIPFTQQGLEKHNDIVTKIYFRASSHRGVQALRQVVEKRNRIEYLTDNDCKRAKKFDITCCNCNEAGHNRLSCTKPCKMCGEPYSRHLTVIEHSGAKVPICDAENYM